MTTVVQLRKNVDGLRAERKATEASLAEVQAALGKVIDEAEAVRLVGLELARKNKLAQLDGAIGRGAAELAEAEEEEKKRRSVQLLGQIRDIMRGHYADVRAIYAEVEEGELERLVREYGGLTHPIHQQQVANELAALRGNLARVLAEGGYKIIQPLGVPAIISAEPER